MSATPRSLKSATLRVTTVLRCTAAVAAISASAMSRGRMAAIRPHSRATSSLIGRIRRAWSTRNCSSQRCSETAAAASVRASRLRVGWMLAHVMLVVCLMPLSSWLYGDASPLSIETVTALLIVFGAAAALSAAEALEALGREHGTVLARLGRIEFGVGARSSP